VQYEAVHGENAATRLANLLGVDEQVRIQRRALATPSAGLLTLEEVAGVLRIKVACPHGGSKGPVEAVQALGGAGGREAARLVAFCRVAALSESLLVCDLGERTARLQAAALLKRTLALEMRGRPLGEGEDPLALMERVPVHARSLCACVECRRVANALVTDGGGRCCACFNEMGTAGSMVSVDADSREEKLRCAKRSSASLRSAIVFEESMGSRAVERAPPKEAALRRMLEGEASGMDTGATARVRRDAKSALEQRKVAMPCGSEHMLVVPIVGKAVRLWGDWYALCAFCGATVKVMPGNRAEGEICCMRCDYHLLHREEDVPVDVSGLGKGTAPHCRCAARRTPPAARALSPPCVSLHRYCGSAPIVHD
jgi:hypothetical protein